MPFHLHERYFVSGCNHAGEIRGIALSGSNVGVSAAELGAEAEAELTGYAGGPMKVFVDSGAFGEVDLKNGPPRVKRLITHEVWKRRLALYQRLARAFGRRLYCVAPDMVAFQAETLERLERYAPEVKELMALGANVIVPVQKGALSMAAFADRAAAILGTDAVVWGVPMKKDATSLAQLVEFATYLFRMAKPTRIDLLGLGIHSLRYAAVVSAVMCNSPWTTVSSDSVRITSMAARNEKNKNGTPRGPRKLTAATDEVKAEGKCTTATEWKAAALARVMNAETREEVQAARRDGWFDPELESAPGLPIDEGCIEYGPGGAFGPEAFQLGFDCLKGA